MPRAFSPLAMIILAHALPVVASVEEAPLYVASCPLALAGVEALLGGNLEVVQLDADTCLLTNGEAREQLLGKNLEASKLWFERHTESGQGADFIHGPVILCRSALIAHFDHLRAEVKPVLSATEREALRRRTLQGEQQRAEQRLALSRCAEGVGCEMCGA